MIFDVDGVIIDSNSVHARTWQVYLQRLGRQAGDLLNRMHGKRNDELVRDFIGGDLSEEEIFRHGAQKERLYRELMAPQLRRRLVPGVRRFLERHRHVRKGVASNAEPANVDFVLDGSGLRRHFEVVVDGHQVTRAKPDPEVFLQAAGLLGADPADCVVFEDSPAGLAAARAAGARTVAVNTSRVELEGAALVVDSFLDPKLEPWLQRHCFSSAD
jgi:HAD superfamily hydrolase (TIGR01509 family)